jgi:hypothetical protein
VNLEDSCYPVRFSISNRGKSYTSHSIFVLCCFDSKTANTSLIDLGHVKADLQKLASKQEREEGEDHFRVKDFKKGRKIDSGTAALTPTTVPEVFPTDLSLLLRFVLQLERVERV